MADHRVIASSKSASGVISSGGGGVATPSQATILSVHVADGTPSANGDPQKHIAVVYQPPSPIGTFAGVWVYLDAPDTAGGLTIADGTVAADGTQPEGGRFEPTSMGFFAYDGDSPVVSFDYAAPVQIENWRVYLVAGSAQKQTFPVQAGEIGETPSRQFVVLPPAGPGAGREFAPLVRDVRVVPVGDLLGLYGQTWATNPLQQTTEGGQQTLRFAIDWTWPTDDQNYQAFGGVNIVISDGLIQTYVGNVDKGAAPLFIAVPLPIAPGTTEYTVYLISYDSKAQNNSLVGGITPAVTFNVTRQLGPVGAEYAALVLADGVHAFVTAAAIAGADGTSLLRITGYWTPPSDPQFGGAEIVVKKPDGNFYTVAAGRLSPIEADISQPASVQSWRFYLRSVDVNGQRNTIKDNGDGVLDAGETPWVDINVGNALGQLNLTKARTDTFSAEFEISSGAFRVKELAADKIKTGILQVGGSGMVSLMKNFDTLGSLIGFVGDDTGTSGYVGAWFKKLRIGGTSPATWKIEADASGNVTIGGSVTVLASIAASQITGGTISASVTMTSPTLVITSGTVTINIDATNKIKIADSSSSVQSILTNTQLRIERPSFGSFFFTSITTQDAIFESGGSAAGGRAQIGAGGLGGNGFVDLYNSSAVKRIELGIDGSGNGQLKFNATHFSLWTAQNARKMLWGTAVLSSGTVNVATGLSVIEGAVATIVNGGGGVANEFLDVGASGGTLTIRSSNGSSAVTVSYMVAGQL